ncbi:MAG: hypothetical protein JOZ05_14055 [Acetobacteraceae bacterium]|nr:hypothetical protein [Acetobacteraceae bacterium]
MIEPETLRRLLEPGHCLVSIYMRVQTSERDLRAHEADLRDLVDQAAERLQRCGMAKPERDAALQPLYEYGGSAAFAAHRQPGLAIFVRPGEPPHLETLPQSPEEIVVVGPDFHIKPLLPLLAKNKRFYVLALSRAKVRLFSATPFSWTELKLETLPEEVQAELDSRPAGDAASLEQAREALMVAEPRRAGVAVKAALGGDDAPLVLAADPNVAGHFVQQVELRNMLEKQLHLNPFGIDEQELHRRAVELMRPELEDELETVLNQINARLGTAEKTVAIRLEEILQAGPEGRVDAVVVAQDEALWGKFRQGGALVAHGTPEADDEDLVNLAAVNALRTGARAFAAPRERLPRQVPAAATLRF